MMNKEDYIQALEEERSKIHVFERELPLCLVLVTQTIEACKQKLCGCDQSSEQTASDCPVLEEFIPVKGVSDFAQEQGNCEEGDEKNGNSGKSDWLRSVMLWSQSPDPLSNSKENSPRKVAIKRIGGCPLYNKSLPAKNGVSPPHCDGSTAETYSCKKKQDKESRKSRRCWSPELHERFLHALQKLGGSQLATPKQIREMMKVDGLTNDEVKSHLQKYRLHTRRPGSSSLPASTSSLPASTSSAVITEQTPQFVVVGGIWVPPEFTSTTAVESSGTKIYAPIAKHGYPFRESLTGRDEETVSESDSDEKRFSEGVHSHLSGNSSV